MNISDRRTRRKSTDWWLIACYLILVAIGWMSVYSSVHSTESLSAFSFAGKSGKQLIWIAASLVTAVFMLFVLSPRIYEGFSLPAYALILILLVAVIFLSHSIKGSKSWFELGPISFQPAEFSKITTSLLLARVMSQYGFSLKRPRDFIIASAIVLLPMAVILLENETGLALVYVGFILVFYREGLSGWVLFMLAMAVVLFIMTQMVSPYASVLFLVFVASLYNALYMRTIRNWFAIYLPSIIALGLLPYLFRLASGINGGVGQFFANFDPVYVLLAVCVIALPIIIYRAIRAKDNSRTFTTIIAFVVGVVFVFSTDIIYDHVLKEHQRQRIEILLGMKEDPSGVGYNVNQSMIAIGSGGLVGKGYLNGTQTTFGFVPEQSTDFIFCTIGEEWGFIGSALILFIYVFMIFRIVLGAEHSVEPFTRVYGYCLAACLFMHVSINIAMTVGLMPVIGIPLPFLSYGGTSLLTFTILLFIYIVLKRNETGGVNH